MAAVEGRVRVAILTTQWLATVLRIKEETNGRRSVMCVDLTTFEAGVSREYHRFVSCETGVIASRTGDVYRLDVDRDIGEGTSFQLGAYIAHMLHRRGRLAGRNDSTADIVLATGQVDDECQVRGVDRIPQKLRVVEEWLESMPLHSKIQLVLPAENKADADGRLDTIIARGVSVLFAEHADDVFGGALARRGDVQSPPLTAARTSTVRARTSPVIIAESITVNPPHGRTARQRWKLAALAVLGLVTSLGVWAFSRPNGEALQVTVVDTVSPTSCFGGKRRPTNQPVAIGGSVTLSSGVVHCKIEVVAVDAKGVRQVAYIVGVDGRSVPPVYLGAFGNVSAALPGDTAAVDVALAPALLQPGVDVSRLPRIAIRMPGGSTAAPEQ